MSDISETSVRAEVRAWLEANWSPDLGLIEWRNKLADIVTAGRDRIVRSVDGSD